MGWRNVYLSRVFGVNYVPDKLGFGGESPLTMRYKPWANTFPDALDQEISANWIYLNA